MTASDDARSDAELVAAINAGDWSAFDILYHRHSDWAYRLAWRFTADETDAQDVVQETFVYLAGKFPGLKLYAALTTLLYPAIRHTALALKRKRRRQHGLPEQADDLLPAPPIGPDASDARQQLAALLATLSEAHREVILMRFVDDMSLEEIAQALAIPPGTAKSRLHHALATLRESPHVLRYFDS